MANYSNWTRGHPSGTSQLRDFDDLHRADKGILEDTLNTEHYFTASSKTSAGQHRPGSARIYTGARSSVSTVGDDGRLLWATDDEQLHVLSSVSTVRLPSLRTANTWTGRQSFSTYINATGGGVQFPATAIPSTDANILDDYKENTFTPVFTIGGSSTGMAYTTRVGRYIKIGKLVFVHIKIVLSSMGGLTGNLNLTSGLPFAHLGNAEVVHGMVVGGLSGAGSVEGLHLSLAAAGTGASVLYATDGAGTATNVGDVLISDTFSAVFTGTYEAAT